MKPQRISRREFVYLGLGGGLVVAGYPFARAFSSSNSASVEGELFQPTPSNTLGPFYVSGAPRREKLVAGRRGGNTAARRWANNKHAGESVDGRET